MDSIRAIIDWMTANSALLWWLFAASVLLLLLSPVIAGWVIVRLPADYFVQTDRRPLATWQNTPALRYTLLVAKNVLGVVLLVAGLIMLIAPGQGLLTLVIGLTLIDFPGKYRLESWFVTRQAVWKSLNWIRKRAGKSEIQRPST
jgi:hypothetical protein